MFVELTFLVVFLPAILHSQRCIDPDGNDVEWFYIYKLPRLVKDCNGNTQNVPTGDEFIYADQNCPDDASKFTKLNESMCDSNNLVSIITEPTRRQECPEDISYVMYNDHSPVSDATTNGHVKGILMADKKHCTWIIHSIPKFPPSFDNGTEFCAANARENGQNIACFTFPLMHCDTIAYDLRKQYINIYRNCCTEFHNSTFPNWRLLLKKQYDRTTPNIRATTLTFASGQPWISVAKHYKANEDIFSVLPSMCNMSDLSAQSWRNGAGGKLPPNCTANGKDSVANIQLLKLTYGTESTCYNTTQDHSKWAVSNNPASNWVAVCSLNRMASQAARSGGCLCFQSKCLSRLLRSSILQTDYNCTTSQ